MSIPTRRDMGIGLRSRGMDLPGSQSKDISLQNDPSIVFAVQQEIEYAYRSCESEDADLDTLSWNLRHVFDRIINLSKGVESAEKIFGELMKYDENRSNVIHGIESIARIVESTMNMGGVEDSSDIEVAARTGALLSQCWCLNLTQILESGLKRNVCPSKLARFHRFIEGASNLAKDQDREIWKSVWMYQLGLDASKSIFKIQR